MTATPIRNDMGNIGCPKCLSALKKAKAPFKIHGEFVGNFESYVCPICNYSALTENGYDEASLQAKQLALNQTIEIPEIEKIEFRVNYPMSGINDQILKENNKLEEHNKLEEYFTDINDNPLLVTTLTKKTQH